MRVLITVWLAGLALASLAACNKAPQGSNGASAPGSTAATTANAGPLGAQDLPHRKPGLWRQNMAIEGMAQAMPVSEMCVDEASEAKASLLGQQMTGEKCQTPQISRSLDGSIHFNFHCDMGQADKMVSSGTLTGDFNSSYKMVIDTTTTGEPAHRMTVTGTRVGACAADQKGGDVMANGHKINMFDSASKAAP